MQKSKKPKLQIDFNKDTLYEVISFLSPFEVVQLFVISKEWCEKLKSSDYWEIQCKKNWKVPKNTKNYFQYFKERIVSLQNYSTSFKQSNGTFVMENPSDNVKIINKFKTKKDKFISEKTIFTSEKVFVVYESLIYCLDFTTKEYHYKWHYLLEKDIEDVTIDYSALHCILIVKQKDRIEAIQPQIGRKTWSFKSQGILSYNFIIKGKVLIFFENDMKNVYVKGLDIETGYEMWSEIIDKIDLFYLFSKGFICSKGFKLAAFQFENILHYLEFDGSFKESPKVHPQECPIVLNHISGSFFHDQILVRKKFSKLFDEYLMLEPFNEFSISTKIAISQNDINYSFDENSSSIIYHLTLNGGENGWSYVIHSYKFNMGVLKTELIHSKEDAKKYIKKHKLDGKVKLEHLSLYGYFLSNIIVRSPYIHFIAEMLDQPVLYCCYKIDNEEIIPVFIKELKEIISSASNFEETFSLLIDENTLILMNKTKIITLETYE